MPAIELILNGTIADFFMKHQEFPVPCHAFLPVWPGLPPQHLKFGLSAEIFILKRPDLLQVLSFQFFQSSDLIIAQPESGDCDGGKQIRLAGRGIVGPGKAQKRIHAKADKRPDDPEDRFCNIVDASFGWLAAHGKLFVVRVAGNLSFHWVSKQNAINGKTLYPLGLTWRAASTVYVPIWRLMAVFASNGFDKIVDG